MIVNIGNDALARLKAFHDLKHKIKQCLKCPDLVESRCQSVPGFVDNDDLECRFFFIGLAPGRLGADVTGVPFTKDRSGQLLQTIITDINLKKIFITNLVKCNPKDQKGRNRKPTKSEINNCSEYLNAEIQIMKPSYIITLGEEAMKYFFGRNEDIKKMKGRLFQKENLRIFPMYHPGYVIRGAYKIDEYKKDFEKLALLNML